MRAFIAIDFDDVLKRDLADLQMRIRSQCPRLSWTKPDQFHLTLKFFADIADEDIMPVCGALDQLAAKSDSFELKIEGVGVFPPSGRVSVVWVGIRDDENRLATLQRRCEDLLVPLGYPAEARHFSPHLTLARNKDLRQSREIRDALTKLHQTDFGSQRITELVFYQSVAERGGHVRKPLSRHALTHSRS